EEGISLRPVGSRKPPTVTSWPRYLSLALGVTPEATEPSAEEVAETVKRLKSGGGAAKAEKSEKSGGSEKQAEPQKTGEGERKGEAGGETEETEEPPSAGNSPVKEKIPALLARLERWLTAHRVRYLKNLRPGATPAEFAALEREIGVKVPDDLRTLLAWRNGEG